jgi:hypothetical protein
MIKCTQVFFLYRRRVGSEALPCFEVPVLEGTVARVIGTEKQKEGPRTLPFSGVKTCPNFQRNCTSTHREDFLPFHKILEDHSLLRSSCTWQWSSKYVTKIRAGFYFLGVMPAGWWLADTLVLSWWIEGDRSFRTLIGEILLFRHVSGTVNMMGSTIIIMSNELLVSTSHDLDPLLYNSGLPVVVVVVVLQLWRWRVSRCNLGLRWPMFMRLNSSSLMPLNMAPLALALVAGIIKLGCMPKPRIMGVS